MKKKLQILTIALAAILLLQACAALNIWEGTIFDPEATDTDTYQGGSRVTTEWQEPEPDFFPDQMEILAELFAGANFNNVNLFFAAMAGGMIDPTMMQNPFLPAIIREDLRAVVEAINVNFFSSIYDPERMMYQMDRHNNNLRLLVEIAAIPISLVGEYQRSHNIQRPNRRQRFLRRMHNLPGLDFTADFINNELIDMMRIGGHMYAVIGDASRYQKSAVVLYFNTPALAAAGIDSRELYALVESGNWTWDAFANILAAVDSRATRPFVTGTNLRDEVAAAAMYASFGQTLMSSGTDGHTMNFDINSDAAMIAHIARFFGAGSEFISGDDALRAFYNGELMFMIGRLGDSCELVTAHDSIGFVPLPRATAGTEFVSFLDPDTTTVFVGSHRFIAHPLAAGTFIQAMNAVAQHYFEAVYRPNFMQYFVREQGSIRMFDVVTQNFVIDASFVMSGVLPSYGAASYRALLEAVVRPVAEQS